MKTNKALGMVELQPVLKCRSQEAFRENPTETRVAYICPAIYGRNDDRPAWKSKQLLEKAAEAGLCLVK